MTRIIVVVCFLLAFAAGLVVGFQSHRPGPPRTGRPEHPSGWLAGELNLTAQQQEELKKIWSDTAARGGHEREERHRQLSRERDDAIAGLIRPEDKGKYDQILKKYADSKAALDRECRGAFDAAVEKTKQILTPEQRAKYDEMLRHQPAERGPRDRHRGEWGSGPRDEHHVASRPATQP